jgi:hypothetical protein
MRRVLKTMIKKVGLVLKYIRAVNSIFCRPAPNKIFPNEHAAHPSTN